MKHNRQRTMLVVTGVIASLLLTSCAGMFDDMYKEIGKEIGRELGRLIADDIMIRFEESILPMALSLPLLAYSSRISDCWYQDHARNTPTDSCSTVLRFATITYISQSDTIKLALVKDMDLQWLKPYFAPLPCDSLRELVLDSSYLAKVLETRTFIDSGKTMSDYWPDSMVVKLQWPDSLLSRPKSADSSGCSSYEWSGFLQVDVIGIPSDSSAAPDTTPLYITAEMTISEQKKVALIDYEVMALPR